MQHLAATPTGELLEPNADELAEALRAFGYDLPTALADLVDNSIAAGARRVRIAYSSDPGSAWLAVIDDGHGMDRVKLREAMRFARNPAEKRSADDLGRFGLGLKTASLAQARALTVLTRTNSGELTGMTWDLDHVKRHRQWLVIPDLDEDALRIAELLEFEGHGTTVLWRKIDKVGHGSELQRRVTDAGKELSLLFHRMMAAGRLKLEVGQRALRPMDPYLRRNPLTQDRGEEVLECDGHIVKVNPVVLPHPSRLTREESLLASGPGGLLGRQGFYVYRGDRLVVPGSWLGLPGMYNSTYTRLARISVEIPPAADLSWKVDVRKSILRPPTPLLARLAELADDARSRSQRVFTHRGTPAAHDDNCDIKPVWQQLRRLGRYTYVVNRSHPLITEALGGPAGTAVEGLLQLIESTVPADLIAREGSTVSGSTEQDLADDQVEVVSAFRAMLSALPEDPERRSELIETLARSEPFNRFPGLIREIIDSKHIEEL